MSVVRYSTTGRAYLGDSVYAEIDEFGDLLLTTNNGYPDDPRNRIVLESSVLSALYDFLNADRRGDLR